MPHVHIGIAQILIFYLGWLLVHVLVQLTGIQLHNTRIGQVMTTFG